MKKKLFLLVILVLVPSAFCKDITMTLDQKEYYFLTGEDALLTIHTNNTYDKAINGMLSYTITQEINQGNFHYSSTNTKSSSFNIISGENDVKLNFGTSENPMTLTVDMDYSFTEQEQKQVILENIMIHFVDDESQKQNQQNQVSEKSQSAQQHPSQQQNSQQQTTQEKMQEMLDEMFNQNQQQNTPQDRLQNSQMSQDSNALKKQIQEQLQQEQKLQKEFQKNLGENNEFQKEHQELLNKGYNLTGGNIDPETNNTGDFELEYQNKDGKKASLQGRLENGELERLDKDSQESRQNMLEKLKENEKFQKYDEQLKNQGFNRTGTKFSNEKNSTEIKLNYKNELNRTAEITAEIKNNTFKKVNLEIEKNRSYWWLILFAIPLIGFLIYKKLHKKPVEKKIGKKKPAKPFDHKKEAKMLLAKAGELFSKKKYKDAYGTAAQAIRLYLAYENRLNKELANDDIIMYLRNNKKPYKNIKKCFDLCSLVEFAKYKANKKDFDKIMNLGKKIIE
ncbi:hypothetical protein GF327_09150 [Candidatus Woesearchaeota archaeon]|nr:hypothetical protein [Candidatus Woesearchaeota archaeon]